ncbi:hypothetical protein QTH90_31480 [Variovorax sp. J2P1-59]|uniref:hypothetical protein n=1 Tax=Variovorax flavidus TaxID=3053501 RepID=UPI002578D815|nr:hypothetical protein [Variovorax sp. J2P1-59]MDM0078958.1 hypothetical protein [Variovorax sp. J2P1-59]
MKNVLSAICAVVLACGCATQPSTVPGQGSGAAYAPMVDMEGVQPDAFARDVETCRTLASNLRVQRTKRYGSDTSDVIVIGVALVFPVAMVGAALVGGIATAVYDEAYPAGVRAEPRMQQSALVDCMARKGYKNMDPNVAVTYVAATQIGPPLPTRKTGLDTYVAEKFAKASNCSAEPRAVLEEKGPGFERYSVQCSGGQSLAIRCEFGNCSTEAAGGN